MALALREATRAASLGEVPVGAVVVQHGVVLGRGGNMVETRGDATAHAEMIALREAVDALGDWRLVDAAMYVTLEPCPMCAGALILARVGTVVFGARDPKFGACGSVVDLLGGGPRWNHRVAVVAGVEEDESARLLREFFARRRAGPPDAEP